MHFFCGVVFFMHISRIIRFWGVRREDSQKCTAITIKYNNKNEIQWI